MTDPSWETRLSRHIHDLDEDGHDTVAAGGVFEPGATSTQVRFVSPRTTLYDTNDEAYVNVDGGIDMSSYNGQRVSIGVNNGNADTASGSWHQLYGGSGLQFPELTADPTSPFENLTYYNTTTHKLRTYDGSTWHDLW